MSSESVPLVMEIACLPSLSVARAGTRTGRDGTGGFRNSTDLIGQPDQPPYRLGGVILFLFVVRVDGHPPCPVVVSGAGRRAQRRFSAVRCLWFLLLRFPGGFSIYREQAAVSYSVGPLCFLVMWCRPRREDERAGWRSLLKCRACGRSTARRRPQTMHYGRTDAHTKAAPISAAAASISFPLYSIGPVCGEVGGTRQNHA